MCFSPIERVELLGRIDKLEKLIKVLMTAHPELSIQKQLIERQSQVKRVVKQDLISGAIYWDDEDQTGDLEYGDPGDLGL